jgi:acetolactate synthase-1/2/3 large subunit
MLTTPTAAPVLPRVDPALAWPAPGALRDLRAMLMQAERPFMIAGGSGWNDESVQALQRFAENWSLPVGCGFRFQDTFDNRHPLYAGDVGIGINPRLARRIGEADLVLAVGVRLGEMTTGGYTLLQAPRPRQRLVHVHAGAEELGRVYAADLMLQAGMAGAGKALESLAAPPSVPWQGWTESAHADYLANLEAPPVEPMDLAVVMKTIQRLSPADTVYTNGAGNYSGWLHRYVQYPGRQHHGRTQLACTSGAMGYGLPAAVAAALLQPGRTVVNIAGDGDFLMNGQELATAAAHGARRLVSVVVDNGSYGTIRMHQEREYPGRVSGSALHNPDFVTLAHAFGWKGERIDHTAGFEPAFARALASGEPTLIHLILPTEVITSRTTLGAIRAAAQARARAGGSAAS